MSSLFLTFLMEVRTERRSLLVGTSRIVRQKADSASRKTVDAYRMISSVYVLLYILSSPFTSRIMIQGNIFVISQVSIGLKVSSFTFTLYIYNYERVNINSRN